MAIVYISHLPFLHLPYFWDEAGQFVPAALDIRYDGRWIPQSTVPNTHPPAVMAYLAAAWWLAGYTPVTTRSAMLLLAALALFCAFLLARELCRDSSVFAPYAAVALLIVCPVLFAQSMLAQLDAPAMLFTSLALLFFLRGRLALSAATCVILVAVKETGIVVPFVFFVFLIAEHRWRQAMGFTAPALFLALWFGLLFQHTGHWTGNVEFARYNLEYPLHPVRVGLAAFRRLYYLFAGGFHWLGAAAILYAWRKRALFQNRPWRIAWLVVLAQVLLVTLVGGAALERYLLPAMPIVYTAMAAGISVWPRKPRLVCFAVLVAGIAAGNWINPPYPFPYDNNLAFTDFLRLQQQAVAYLVRRCPGVPVQTAWPLTLQLSRPELGLVTRRIPVDPIPNFSPRTLENIDWGRFRVLVAFSRNWDPDVNVLHYPPLLRLWERSYGEIPNVSRHRIWRLVPFPPAASFERRGQWVDIYVNPTWSAVRSYNGTAENRAHLVAGAVPGLRQ
jgi:4-amino-4-deoxy-L-arabinose transferase-like glycosyltransferase